MAFKKSLTNMEHLTVIHSQLNELKRIKIRQGKRTRHSPKSSMFYVLLQIYIPRYIGLFCYS